MRIFYFSLVAMLFFACGSSQKSSKSAKTEKLPKRDFLVLKADTGSIKMPEQFNVENRNNQINLSGFLENRYLFQINGLPFEVVQKDSATINAEEVQVIIVRPPMKPCVCLDKSRNHFSVKSNQKQKVLVFHGELACDGVLFEFTGAYTGEIPEPSGLIEE